jgi:20S proteasome alpha/beta subunit
MTIALALIGTDGIVMSTDSRSVDIAESGMDRRHRDDAVKLHKLNKTGLALLGDADTDYGNYLIEIYKDKALDKNFNMRDIVGSFSAFVRRDAGQYLLMRRLSGTASLVFVLAGYNPKNEPELYRIDDSGDIFLFGPKKKQSPQCLGVGNEIVQSWFNRLKVEQMDTEMLKKLSAFLILEVAHVSDYVNRAIQMYVITQSGVQSISQAEISLLKHEADEEHRKLTSRFRDYLKYK